MLRKLSLDHLPHEVLQEILALVPAVQIPSLRRISRYIKPCADLHYCWNLKALKYTEECKPLAADWLYDIATASLADLKYALIRTEKLRKSWEGKTSSQTKPSTVWRYPKTDWGFGIVFLWFATTGFVFTMSRVYDVWDLQSGSMLGSSDELDQYNMLILTPYRAPSTIFAISLGFTADLHSERITLYEIRFPASGKGTVTFIKLAAYDMSSDAPTLSDNFIPPCVVNLGDPCMVIPSVSDQGDALLLCVIFDKASRYCVFDPDVVLLDDMEFDIVYPPSTDLVILRTCCPNSGAQFAFHVGEVYAYSIPVTPFSRLNYRHVTYPIPSLEWIKRPYSWPPCCGIPGQSLTLVRPSEALQDWPAYSPASAPFRTSTTLIVKREAEGTGGGSPGDTFYLIQFYSSVDGPITRHRFVHKLPAPYLNGDDRPIVASSFDHFCWIERTSKPSDDGPSVVLRMLSFPRTYDCNGKLVDSEDPHEEPTICTLDVPEDVLLYCYNLTIAIDVGGVQVETLDRELHTFYYV